MIYDFDHGPERRGTDCLKYDFARERGKPADVLPLWMADMDFPAPAPVLAKIHAMADHGIFGYTDTKPAYDAAVCGWFRRHFGWDARPEWLVKTPGVVFALAMAVRALTQPGDAVVIQPPVYYPFFEVIRDNGRRIAENPLRCEYCPCGWRTWTSPPPRRCWRKSTPWRITASSATRTPSPPTTRLCADGSAAASVGTPAPNGW